MATPPILSPEDELKRQLGLVPNPAGFGTPPPVQPPPTAGGIVPAAKPVPIATPSNVTPIVPQQRQTDTDELNRLKNSPAGVEQLQHKHPILGTIARIGDIALSSLFPTIATQIPGTELRHAALVNREQGRVANDLAGEKTEAETQNLQDQPEVRAAKLELEQEKQNETAQHNQDQNSQQLRKLGLKTDTSGQIVPVAYEEMSPQEQAVHDLKESQKEAQDARAQLDIAKSDPNSPLYQQTLRRLQVAEQNSRNAAARIGLSNAQFQNKLQEQELIKPSGQTQSRASAAQAAMDLIPKLQEAVKAHGDQLGPIVGRLNRGELAIGNVPPDIAQLYTEMESFNALQPAIHGFRSAEFVKDWKTALGSLERDPQAFIHGLEGLRPTMESVAKEGRTYHKRTVEGRDTLAEKVIEYVRGADGKLHPKQ